MYSKKDARKEEGKKRERENNQMTTHCSKVKSGEKISANYED